MNPSSEESLIAEKIRKFYFVDEKVSSDNTKQCFHNNGAYKFGKITELWLPPISTALQLQDYDYYYQCCTNLSPLFEETHNLFNNNDSLLHSLQIEWMGSNFTHYQDLAQEISITSTVEQILFLTGVLEHALSNVFYTKTKARIQPPHLLKDLLSSAELADVFGEDAIAFLKIIMGTPKSLNLRNIVWHGFPQPHEIPKHFVAVLLCTSHSLGCMLAEQQTELQQRNQIQDFDSHLSKFNSANLQISNDCYANVLYECKWLSAGHKLYWQQLFKYYNSQQYWQFVVLIFPQIELLLRLIYAKANEYDISAKLDEYYITMDTIFECDVPSLHTKCRKNQLLPGSHSQAQSVHISVGAMKCLYDLFVAPNGPRLRDKVSHGEVNISAINNALLCRILLHLSLHLLTSDEQRFPPLAAYESKFHLNCLTIEVLKDAGEKLQQFCQKHVELKVVGTANDCSSIPEIIQIFQRPRKEAEIMELVRKISKCHLQVIQNYEEALEQRFTELSQRELHSKRRRTLEKQMVALPTTCKTLNEILQCLNVIFLKFQIEAEEICANSKNIELLLRFLKLTLQVSENLVKCAHKEHNEWLKALELCQKFATQRQRLFIWQLNADNGV